MPCATRPGAPGSGRRSFTGAELGKGLPITLPAKHRSDLIVYKRQ